MGNILSKGFDVNKVKSEKAKITWQDIEKTEAKGQGSNAPNHQHVIVTV